MTDHPAEGTQTDDAEAVTVLAALRHCANACDSNARIVGNIRAGDISRVCRLAINALRSQGANATTSSPAVSVIKPTDANISVLAEALYHCGCPAGGMTVGECAEQGVCGCSIRAARIKGCMGTEHQSFPREEGSKA